MDCVEENALVRIFYCALHGIRWYYEPSSEGSPNLYMDFSKVRGPFSGILIRKMIAFLGRQ